MLSISDVRPTQTCAGFQRREFLRVGSLGLGGLSLAELMGSGADAAEAAKYLRGRSVVYLFLQGGPSHIELFDPKMTAPAEFRSITGEVKTKHTGITFGGTFPKLSQLADKFSIVRSYGSKNGGHTYLDVASGRNPLKATMSALSARILGPNNPNTGIPNNVLVLPEAVDSKLKLGKNFETNALPTLTATGDLGDNYAAFNPVGGGKLKENMRLRLSSKRFEDRRGLLMQLDRLRKGLDSTRIDEQLHSNDLRKQQAFDVILRGVEKAFDLSQEDPRTVAAYDTSKLFDNATVQRWFDMRRASNLLGKQLLMARRLCEAGCGFVTVSDCGWDMHSNNNSPKNLGAMHWLGHQVDHAVAAFIEDVERRGLSDKILLVVTGEMGRTPRINSGGGRDHYGDLTPLLVYGGGLKMGRVIGASDHQAAKPATRGYTPKNLLATIMHSLFDLGELRLRTEFPRDILKVTESGEPIAELM